MSRRLLAVALAGATVTAGSLALTPTAGAGEPTPSASPISVQGPTRLVAYSHRGRVWTDLGVRLVAGAEPFEIFSNRPSYDEPIRSVWRRPAGDVPLPEGAMDDFSRGLDRLVRITITRARSGERVQRLRRGGCLNGESSRTRPDAPARSPYPLDCPWNPYTLGSVMGIQAGWAKPILNYWRPLRLERGRYDVTTTIAPKWLDVFGIAPEDASTTSRLVVKRGTDEFFRQSRRDAAEPAPAPAAHEPSREQAGAPVPETAPDLRSLPAFGVQLNRKGTALRFGATVWNGGGGPMVVDGFRSPDEDDMAAYQYFFDADGEQVGYQRVGEFHFHAKNHQHWHFEDFARYRLLNADKSLAVRSTKASFCLANTDAVDYTIPAADWQPGNTDLSSACGGPEALSLREVLSNGSGDTYHQYRAGQAFRIGNLPDGTYYIAVEANPKGTLVESDTTNNSSLRLVRIRTNRHGERVVRVPQVGIIDESMPRFFRR